MGKVIFTFLTSYLILLAVYLRPMSKWFCNILLISMLGLIGLQSLTSNMMSIDGFVKSFVDTDQADSDMEDECDGTEKELKKELNEYTLATISFDLHLESKRIIHPYLYYNLLTQVKNIPTPPPDMI